MSKHLLIYLLFSVSVCAVSAQQRTGLLPSFIPKGYTILDSVSGDMNKDGLRDYAIILSNNAEKENPDTTRPLLLLFQTPQHEFLLHARNDHVVLCQSCGGVFGDPLDGIFIENGLLKIHHYGGSSWRWARDIEFTYDPSSKSFKLYRDTEISHYTGSPGKMEKHFRRKQDFGKLPFEKFNYNAQ